LLPLHGKGHSPCRMISDSRAMKISRHREQPARCGEKVIQHATCRGIRRECSSGTPVGFVLVTVFQHGYAQLRHCGPTTAHGVRPGEANRGEDHKIIIISHYINLLSISVNILS
jgi:hypothetical protein